MMCTKVSPTPLLSLKARRNIESSVRVENVGKKMKLTKAEEKEKIGGLAQLGPSIEDLFTHSYSPPPSRSRSHSRIAKSASSWVCVASARVWDSTTERFPVSVRDIRKFGA